MSPSQCWFIFSQKPPQVEYRIRMLRRDWVEINDEYGILSVDRAYRSPMNGCVTRLSPCCRALLE